MGNRERRVNKCYQAHINSEVNKLVKLFEAVLGTSRTTQQSQTSPIMDSNESILDAIQGILMSDALVDKLTGKVAETICSAGSEENPMPRQNDPRPQRTPNKRSKHQRSSEGAKSNAGGEKRIQEVVTNAAPETTPQRSNYQEARKKPDEWTEFKGRRKPKPTKKDVLNAIATKAETRENKPRAQVF